MGLEQLAVAGLLQPWPQAAHPHPASHLLASSSSSSTAATAHIQVVQKAVMTQTWISILEPILSPWIWILDPILSPWFWILTWILHLLPSRRRRRASTPTQAYTPACHHTREYRGQGHRC